eukprot:TRINITY_DN30767_c0_g1_i1.p1 TRINITY_DN30767_c0_g1~~TRINITY_DN30767_c0_g1_i1.p1  ORF type:complete len:347 (-),score=85.74 TRINITY_DN30767_c0_g1_i1:506-1546(-)
MAAQAVEPTSPEQAVLSKRSLLAPSMVARAGVKAVRGLADTAADEAKVLVKAAQRVAALGIIDASLQLPALAAPVCGAALSALNVRKTSTGADFMLYRPSTSQKALLVLCHPSEGQSMCRTMAQMWEDELRVAGIEYTTVDICHKMFEGRNVGPPDAAGLKEALNFGEGQAPAGVDWLQARVEEARFLIFVHPVFWFEVPSQLKGFMESVFSSGFAYRKLPSCWTLNRAVGILEKLPVVPGLLQRYSAYGMLRDKRVFISRTMGGPGSGLGIFGHGATSLESTCKFVGAHVDAVDTLSELDDQTPQQLKAQALPELRRKLAAHCNAMAAAKALGEPREAYDGLKKP